MRTMEINTKIKKLNKLLEDLEKSFLLKIEGRKQYLWVLSSCFRRQKRKKKKKNMQWKEQSENYINKLASSLGSKSNTGKHIYDLIVRMDSKQNYFLMF